MSARRPGRPVRRPMVTRPAAILIGVLLTALVLVIAVPGSGPGGGTTVDLAHEALALVESFEARLAPPPGLQSEPRAVDSPPRRSSIRDIFRPVHDTAPPPEPERTTPASDSGPVLGGVLLDGDRRQAVIDGRVLAEGDSIRGYFLVEVRPQSVLLWRDGEFRRVVRSTHP